MNINVIIKNIFNNIYMFSVISKLIQVITGVAYIILFTRYLGPELKGDSAIILNFVALSSVVMGFGIDQAYPRYKKLEGDILDEFIGIIKGMFFVYCTLSILLVLIIPVDINTKIAFILAPMTICIRQLNYIVLVEYPKRRNMATILLNIIDVILVTGLFMFTKANYQIMIGFLLFKELLYLIIVIQNLRKNILVIKTNFSNLIKYIKYGFVQMLIVMLMAINYRIDVLMLNGKVPIADIGIYSLGVSLAELIWLIPDALKEILVSRLSKGKTENEVAKVIRISLLFSIISLVFVAIFGRKVIDVFFGVEFSSSYEITIIMLFGVVGMIFYKLVHSYNLVNGYRAINLILLGGTALINIIGNLIFIPIYGIEGAAYTSVISYLLCGISFLMYFRHKSGIAMKDLLLLQKSDLISFSKIINAKKC